MPSDLGQGAGSGEIDRPVGGISGPPPGRDVAKLDQIQTLARQVDQMGSSGQMPDQATAESYETAVRDLEMSPVGQAYVVARSNFEKLMAKVNQQISEGMEKGASSSIITLG